jgi:hypothetical protein
MDPFLPGPETLRLIDARGEPVAGGIYTRQDARRVFWRPLRPLEPGSYHLMIAGPQLTDMEGRPLGGNIQLEIVRAPSPGESTTTSAGDVVPPGTTP